jgi:hypothetical protein
MENDSKIPDGWAMLEDLAKRINEGLNKKSIRLEDELADALADMALDVALIEPDPQDWGRWVIYLLKQVEEELKSGRKGIDFSSVFDELPDLMWGQ